MDFKRIRRKGEHLALAQKLFHQSHAHHYFDQVRLIHTGLPEMSIADVNPHVNLAGKISLKWPFFIEAMTGGNRLANRINHQLATAAADHDLAMATGSMQVVLNDPSTAGSFQTVRQANPKGPVFANLSASASVSDCQRVVKLLGADALELHINAGQELIMPEGDRRFHWLDNIQQITSNLSVPVIVKEVGFGMSRQTVECLMDAGVSLINVSGRGGTNFAMIENARQDSGTAMDDLDSWGQTTPESLLEARAAVKNRPASMNPSPQIIASGGITSPLDVVKAGAMGASCCGVAGYFLNVLLRHGPDGLDDELTHWQDELIKLMTLLGCHRYSQLHNRPVVLAPELESYARQRHLI